MSKVFVIPDVHLKPWIFDKAKTLRTIDLLETNGFVKKTQKTPKADLDLAQKYKSDYERRYCHE